MKYIGLLDCNNFFVSCERLFRPDLIKTPVVVLSSNDGCIVARSQEIKDKGIPMGVPYFQVKDILQDIGAVSFSSHFALYRDISRRVFDVVRESFENIEQYSIDECFFTFESDNPEEIARELKRQVEHKVGIPVSVGISTSKTRAKYTSLIAKKTGGVAVWGNDIWSVESKNIKLTDIWGVGVGRSREFTKHGLLVVSDLTSLQPDIIAKLFGIEGVRLRAELLGEQIIGFKSQKIEQKSITSSRSFAETSSDINVLENAVMFHLYQTVKDLEMMDMVTSTLRVLILPSRHSNFALQGLSIEVILSYPTRDLFVLQKEAKKLLLACFKPGVPYKKAGVVMSKLSPREGQTMSLFSSPKERDTATSLMSKTIFDINNKQKKVLIQLGQVQGKTAKWNSRNDSISPSYTTDWADLCIVKS